MASLSDFIVSYPDPDDPTFGENMSIRKEFRDLLYQNGEPVANEVNKDDTFFKNYQMLVGRWMAPWTNNRTMLIRWDPGVGKTRAALIYSMMWMRNSKHSKALLLSTTDIVHKALDTEITKYNNFDIVLERGTYLQGRRAHGKTISRTRFVQKQGFSRFTIVRLINRELKALFGLTGSRDKKIDYRELLRDNDNVIQLKEHLKAKYSDTVIIVDEAHNFRYTGEGKQNYEYLMIFLDAIRDVSPILFLTATPVVNSWKDAISVVSMMYDAPTRNSILEEISHMPKIPRTRDEIAQAVDLLQEYARGKVSYRDAMGIVPTKIYLPPLGSPLPDNGTYTVDGEETVDIEFTYPVIMSMYQSEQIAAFNIRDEMDELSDIDDVSEALFVNVRLMYDIVGPVVETDDGPTPIDPESLVVEDKGRFYPSTESNLALEGGTESVFNLVLDEQGNINKDEGLGKYSIKYATLIHMLATDPRLQGKAGYIHTLWVQRGIKPIAAALASNGWEQYAGTETVTSPGDRPRFALIMGGVQDTVRDRIIDTFNSDRNRDGSILKLVIGSRKSGISISFVNARFFIELSPDFNKATRIQAEGRVFRADSLTWADEAGIPRAVYTANMVALPYGSDQLPSIQDGIIKDEEYAVDPITGNVVDSQGREDMIEAVTLDDMEGAIDEGLLPEDATPTDYVDAQLLWFNPYTVEIWLYYLSEIKHTMGGRMMEGLKMASIEYLVERHLDKEPIARTDALLYSHDAKHRIKEDMLFWIPRRWRYPINEGNMYTMSALAELMSSHTMALTKYGFPRPVQSYGNVATAYQGDICTNTRCAFNIIYDKNFFLTTSISTYSQDDTLRAIDMVNAGPDDEYLFYVHMSRKSIADLKIIALEAALSIPTAIEGDRINTFMTKRDRVLALYDGLWDTFGNDRVVHILWYSIKHSGGQKKIGTNNEPVGNTRMLVYDPVTRESVHRWHYVDDVGTEAMYLSRLSGTIYDREMDIIEKAQDIGYYVHLSLRDGVLRLREISLQDKRSSKVSVVAIPGNVDAMSEILDMAPGDILATYQGNNEQLQSDIYYAAKVQGLLIIR